MNKDLQAIMADHELKPPTNPKNVVMIDDTGRDLDDEFAILTAAALDRMGLIKLTGVVANLRPQPERARLTKGTLNLLGLANVPVGIGSECHKYQANPYESNVGYLASESDLFDGRSLLLELLEKSVDKSVVLVLNSGLTDASRLIMDDFELFTNKVCQVAVMGGIRANGNYPELDDTGFLLPQIGRNGAYNNNVDEASALFVHRFCQEFEIPLVVLMREAAYACQFPMQTYELLAATGNPVGSSMMERQSASINNLWQEINAPPGSPKRGKVPLSRDRKWFVDVFCGGIDHGINETGNIWPYVRGFQLYDALNLVAAVPQLRRKFFNPIEVKVKEASHFAIGLTKQKHGIRNEDALRDLITRSGVAILQSR